MTDEQKDNLEADLSDVYAVRSLSAVPESFVPVSNHTDIFAVKKEHAGRLDSIIGLSLGAGVFLCHAYRLDQRMDQDEQGDIWKASDLQAGKNVRIYLPPPKIRKDPSAVERLKQHARRVEALDHPRILQSFDHFIDPEHGFFAVQQYIAGKTLDVFWKEHVRKQGKPDPPKAVKILTDIARSLDYAHGIGIFHGCLSPKAIIVDLNEAVYVSHFALMPLPCDQVSTDRQVYIAPEMLPSGQATSLSDLFSVAVMAYELFSGRLPHGGETMEPSLLLPCVPSTVDMVIQKALSRIAEERYDSCGAFVKALEAGLRQTKEIKTLAKPTSAVSSSGSALRLFAGMMLFLLFFFAATAVWFPEYLDRKYLAQMITDVPNLSALPLSEESGNAVSESAATSDIFLPNQDDASPQESAACTFPSSENRPCPSAGEELSTFPSEEGNGVKWTSGMESDEPIQESPFASESEESPAEVPDSTNISPPIKGERREIVINFINYSFRWCPHSPNQPEGFWILEKAVTQEMWESMMGVDYQPDYGPRLPVRNVSWEKCQRFIEIVRSHAMGQTQEMFSGFRIALPKESQWDQALQDGMITSEDGFYEWCGDWFDEEKRYRTVLGHERLNRDPASRTGYFNVGFRLVLVRDTSE